MMPQISGTEQAGDIVSIKTWSVGVVYEAGDTYIIDDGHDQLMLGFEHDLAHGFIVPVTRALLRQLRDQLRDV